MRLQCANCSGVIAVDTKDLATEVTCRHCDETIMVPETAFGKGVVLGDFAIEMKIGSGGMATVFLAHQISLNRQIALKILHPELAQDKQQVKDFVKEAQIAASLNHPNIVQIHSVGNEDGHAYFAMELVLGASVQEILQQEGKPDLDWSLMVTRRVAQGLRHAWNKAHLVHRDIKPDNIIIREDGAVKLADMGLARPAGGLGDIEEGVVGTPHYIPPEALLGNPVDFRSDIYSLGATLYHMATGEFPFEGRNLIETAKMHLRTELEPAGQRCPDVPGSVSRLISKMMAKKPEERHESLDELLGELKQVASKSRRSSKSKRQRKSATSPGMPVVMADPKGVTVNTTKVRPKSTKNVSPLILGVLVGALVVMVAAFGVLGYTAFAYRPSQTAEIGRPKSTREGEGNEAAGTNQAQTKPSVVDLDVSTLIPGLQMVSYRRPNLTSSWKQSVVQRIEIRDITHYKKVVGAANQGSIRWTGILRVEEPGEFTFFATCAGGQKLYIKDRRVINDWEGGASRETKQIVRLPRGLFPIRYELRQVSKAAKAQLEWSGKDFERQRLTGKNVFTLPPAASLGLTPGLRGEYFDGTDLEDPILTRTDGVINILQNTFRLPDGPTDDLSVRWTGKLWIWKQGSYKFKALADDGSRLWVGGKLLIDDWTDGKSEKEASVDLQPGIVDLRYEYYQDGGPGAVRLSWSGPGFEGLTIGPKDVFSEPAPNTPAFDTYWGPGQTTGPPDTRTGKDSSTAWAPAKENGGAEWLILCYANAVEIDELQVYENLGPGAITKVVALVGNREVVLWEVDATPKPIPPGKTVLKTKANPRANFIKIYLNTKKVKGWNEIDAVELIGKDKSRQWASAAEASSIYAD